MNSANKINELVFEEGCKYICTKCPEPEIFSRLFKDGGLYECEKDSIGVICLKTEDGGLFPMTNASYNAKFFRPFEHEHVMKNARVNNMPEHAMKNARVNNKKLRRHGTIKSIKNSDGEIIPIDKITKFSSNKVWIGDWWCFISKDTSEKLMNIFEVI